MKNASLTDERIHGWLELHPVADTAGFTLTTTVGTLFSGQPGFDWIGLLLYRFLVVKYISRNCRVYPPHFRISFQILDLEACSSIYCIRRQGMRRSYISPRPPRAWKRNVTWDTEYTACPTGAGAGGAWGQVTSVGEHAISLPDRVIFPFPAHLEG